MVEALASSVIPNDRPNIQPGSRMKAVVAQQIAEKEDEKRRAKEEAQRLKDEMIRSVAVAEEKERVRRQQVPAVARFCPTLRHGEWGWITGPGAPPSPAPLFSRMTVQKTCSDNDRAQNYDNDDRPHGVNTAEPGPLLRNKSLPHSSHTHSYPPPLRLCFEYTKQSKNTKRRRNARHPSLPKDKPG